MIGMVINAAVPFVPEDAQRRIHVVPHSEELEAALVLRGVLQCSDCESRLCTCTARLKALFDKLSYVTFRGRHAIMKIVAVALSALANGFHDMPHANTLRSPVILMYSYNPEIGSQVLFPQRRTASQGRLEVPAAKRPKVSRQEPRERKSLMAKEHT